MHYIVIDNTHVKHTTAVFSVWWKISSFDDPRFHFHWKFPRPHGKEWNMTLYFCYPFTQTKY